jgi:hypothetical protein
MREELKTTVREDTAAVSQTATSNPLSRVKICTACENVTKQTLF